MKRALTLLLATTLLACSGSSSNTPEATPQTPPAEPPTPTVERAPLGEMQVVEHPSEEPFVTIRVVFDAGSSEDLPGQEGITALTADLMVEGGAGAMSYAEITEAFFPMAASVSALTSREQTVFTGRVHVDHLDAYYELFRSILLEPRMPQTDFERLRSRAVDTITLQLRGNDDEEFGKEALQAMIYEGHPYGHPETGTIGALEALNLEDVLAHRDEVFCGARATVGVAGGYPDGFAERVAGDIESLNSNACVGRRLLPEVALDGPRVWLVDKPAAGAVAISMGMPIDVVRGNPDYAALVLAGAYFGQHRTFAGRLMSEMRGERGLNYGDYAYIEHFEQAGWSAMPRPNVGRRQQYFSIWIRPVSPDNAHFATRMAVRELREFVEHGLSQEDFDRTLAYVRGYYPLFLQTASRQLGFAIDDAFYGHEAEWIELLRNGWDELTREQVNEAIRRHVDPSNLQIAIIHPDAEAFAETLASDAPSPITYAAEVPEEVLTEDEAIVPYEIGIPRDRMHVVPADTMFE